MLVSEFLLIGTLGGLIGLLITRSVGAGIIVGAAAAIAVDVIGWLLAVRATIRLTRAVEVGPEQAHVLHNVIDGLCIATGLPKPKVYIVDDPAPNAFAFGRSRERAGVAVTSGLLNLMSRRELEGVLAHELSHIRNRDVQVTTLAVTTVGILVVVADISARASFFSEWGDDDGGGMALLAVAAVAGALAFGAKLLSFAISRHREELADTSAVAIISPGGCGARWRSSRRITPWCTTSPGRPRTCGSKRHCKKRATRSTPRSTGCSTLTRRSPNASRCCGGSRVSTPTHADPSTRPAPAFPSTSRSWASRPRAVNSRCRRCRRSNLATPPARRPPRSPRPRQHPAGSRTTPWPRRSGSRRVGTTSTSKRCATGRACRGRCGSRPGTASAGCRPPRKA